MKTVRRPPYPKWNPGYFPCSSLTPLPLSSRRPSVSFGGFGLKRPGRPRIDHVEALKAALHTIDQHLHKMEERQEELEFHESQEAEAKRISASLPQGPSAELNLRYRKSTDSSYYRALDEYWKMKSRNHKIGTPPTDNGAVDIS